MNARQQSPDERHVEREKSPRGTLTERIPWRAMLSATVIVVSQLATLLSAADPTPSSAAATTKGANGEGSKLALLVGCTKYDNLPETRWLKGPANDAALLRRVLMERYGFSDRDIKLLSEDAGEANRPTRAHIVREFERLITEARHGDQVVVLLAGHGSQQPDRPDPKRDDSEPDGLDEIFLPADIGKWEGQRGAVANGIVDDEIFDWTQAICRKGAMLWIIFDSCHSGTALRGGGDEIAREASPESDLGIPAEALQNAAQSAGAAKRVSDAAFDVESAAGHVVAFYAAQPQEPAMELLMPLADGAGTRKQHGAFSFALCSLLSEPTTASLTYRDLGELVWGRYKSWRWNFSAPFVDGTDLDRQVLGAGRRHFQFRIASGSARRGWKINGGAVHGLASGTVLAVRNAAGTGTSLGYVRIVDLNVADARVKPCEYGGLAEPSLLALNLVCEPVLIEYGDLRLRLAVDRESATDAGSRQLLVQLEDELQKSSREPKAFFAPAVVSDAEWVVQARVGRLELLPKDAALIVDAAKIPIGTPRFVLDERDAAADVERWLERVFRAQNLMQLAGAAYGQVDGGDSGPGKFTSGLKVEMLRYRDKRDRQGTPVKFQGGGPRFVAGDWIGWRLTNRGREAVDVTLLYIDSQLAVQAVFPRARAVGVNNRLSANESYSTPPVEVTDDTLGREHLVVIAVPGGTGPQRDFRCLAEPTLEAARRGEAQARGGGESVLKSPLGRLLQYAAYNEGGATRGVALPDIEENRLKLVSWTVVD